MKSERSAIKLFADGAKPQEILELATDSRICGFTTNPTLMRTEGITNYREFAQRIVPHIQGKPISLEVFSDDFFVMKQQAKTIASWGENIYVKIPITNTSGEFATPVIRELLNEGVKVNITAVFTPEQAVHVLEGINPQTPFILSVFAGRIADTAVDPVPIVRKIKKMMVGRGELLWASTREILNIRQASDVGADIITVTPEILKKLRFIGMDLHDLSRETVRMFYEDAKAAGFKIEAG